MVDVLEKNLYYFTACLEPYGFEVYPFLIDWYNECVDTPFKLDYPKFTLAYVVLSTPSVFENVFIPFIKAAADTVFDELHDPIDSAIHKKMEEARNECTLIDNETVDLFHDYDLTPTRRPKLLVQTAADVAGAVRLYQSNDLDDFHKFETKTGKIFPCALHPQYGGWFAIRGVYIFKKLIHPLLERPRRLVILESQNEIQDLLMKYNLHWQDWNFRDVIEPVERYSKIQRRYFETQPNERKSLLALLKEYDTASEEVDVAGDILRKETSNGNNGENELES